MKKAIINFTPTGMLPTKQLTPYACLTPDEIIHDVLESRKFGVSMVHLHARDEETLEPTWKIETYEKIISGIRKEDEDLVLITSTSGRSWSEFEKRSEVLDLKPDMASLTPSSLNFNNQASITTPEMVQKLAQKMKELGVKPELEAFDAGMINYAKYLYKKGLIDPPFFFTFILGNVACAQANILNLAVMRSELPENSYFVVGGVGDSQLNMNVEGLLNADGIRVGLEDMYFWSAKRERLCTNIEVLERTKTIMDILEIEAATPQEVREMLGLERVRDYFQLVAK